MQVAWITRSLLDAKISEIAVIQAELWAFLPQISLPWQPWSVIVKFD